MSDNNYIQEKYRVLNYGNEQFDKNVLFIASGALGISFGFIEKIVPNLANANCTNFLINSWYCFAGVIFLSLVAHFISVLANRWAIINDDAEADRYNKTSRNWNYTIRLFNILMIAGLLLGILLLIILVNKNI